MGIFELDLCSFLQVLSWSIFVESNFCSILQYDIIICTIFTIFKFGFVCRILLLFFWTDANNPRSHSADECGGSCHFPPPATTQDPMTALTIWRLLTLAPLSHPCTVQSIRTHKPISPIRASDLKANFTWKLIRWSRCHTSKTHKDAPYTAYTTNSPLLPP